MARLIAAVPPSRALPPPSRFRAAFVAALICPLLCACPPKRLVGARDPAYETVLTTSPDEPVDFIHIVEDQPGHVVLDVYHGGPTKKATWESRQGAVVTPVQLASGEDFVLSPDWRLLAKRAYVPNPGQPQSTATVLTFIKGPPEADDPPAVPGARLVQISGDGSLLLFTQHATEQSGPAQVEVRGLGAGDDYVPSGSYRTDVHGTVQASNGGRVVVQDDAGRLRVFTGSGEERQLAETSAGMGFRLSDDGSVLAVREPDGVLFQPIDANGNPLPGPGARVNLANPPLEVALAGRWALIRTRKSVLLVNWHVSQTPVWEKPVADGSVMASVDLLADPSGDVLAAVGWLEVLQPAQRSGGQFSWGSALAHVAVFSRTGDTVSEHSFRTFRWTYDAPRVRILERSRRMVVRTGDVVLISPPLAPRRSP
jgi:hypothetical protein